MPTTELNVEDYAMSLRLGNVGAVLAFPFMLNYGGIAGKAAKGVAIRTN